MKNAEEFFDGNAPDNDNVIITGKRYSRQQCIELMEQYASLREKETAIEFAAWETCKQLGILPEDKEGRNEFKEHFTAQWKDYTKHKEG